MNASRCTHWLDLEGHLFDCELPLGHDGKHVDHKFGECAGNRPRGGKALKNVVVRIAWDR